MVRFARSDAAVRTDETAPDQYTYTQIGTVSSNITSFQDTGAISGNNSYNNAYQVKVLYSWGAYGIAGTSLPGPPPIPPSNLYITANLIRNGTGRWQVMISGLPTNTAQTIQLNWSNIFDAVVLPEYITTAELANNIYPITDTEAVSNLGCALLVQLIGADGNPGQAAYAGVLNDDAPYFVDGRQHLQESLAFLLRAAGRNQFFSAGVTGDTRSVETTNFVEVGYLHPDWTYDWTTGNNDWPYVAGDNLWPFTFDYELYPYLDQITNTPSPFVWQPNFLTIPAPPVLTMPDPYWIDITSGFNVVLTNGQLEINNAVLNEWGFNLSNLTISLQTGWNLYGLEQQPGLITWFDGTWPWTNAQVPVGGSTTLDGVVDWGNIYTQTQNPQLQTTGYYFAPVVTPGKFYAPSWDYSGLLVSPPPAQTFPLPLDSSFAVTNQAPLIVGTVGQPMVIGGWAKQEIVNGATGKYGYLGQYFETNAFLLSPAGGATTNSAGIVSPYGDFFPLQAGLAEMITMPDITTGMQGSNFVRIVSLNVDANHDGTMDFSYSGPDQNSSSRPFRFWVNDVNDSGDYGGDGIPGIPGLQGDGVTQINLEWFINGRRNLVNFFPVYLNIGSLFQSNALTAGISPSDTNYQFVLSQADGALRFLDLKQASYEAD